MKYSVLTFGCQMNISDSERIHTQMKQAGFAFHPTWEEADLVIMNTCSVKQKAEDKVWGQLTKARALRKNNPQFRVGLTGCMVRKSGLAQKWGELVSGDALLQSTDNLDFVFRIEDLPKVPTYLSVLYGQNLGQDYADEVESYFQVRPDYEKSFQVYVPVQTGCNKYCTYCIVPFTRKREVSRPMEEILGEVRALVEKGAREVTLLGQTVNSYRHPKSTAEHSTNNFAELLYQIDKIPGLDRLRYTSPHPMDFDDELIRAHRELKTMCNHVHLPLQSGDNEILRRMNRKYTREQFLDVVHRLKEAIPDVAITTDVIVGFCGETEEQFMQTVELFREVGFDMSFTSRYSARKGTYSAKHFPDDVTPEEKARRWHYLNEVMIEQLKEKNARYVQHYFPVLVERILENGLGEGQTRSAKRVHIRGVTSSVVGSVIPVKMTQALPFLLLGEALIP